MKILDADQIREWDNMTISKQGITSLDLMERAALSCKNYLLKKHLKQNYIIFCGPGNNGGDGLALARLLYEEKINVQVITVWNDGTHFSTENISNQKRLPKKISVLKFDSNFSIPFHAAETIIIDAILGNGQNRPLDGIYKKAVEWINQTSIEVLSIDIPTGIYEVCHKKENTAIEADKTLCFEIPKLSFFFPENDRYIGEWEILTIGSDPEFALQADGIFSYLTPEEIQHSKKKRRKYSHKGTFGSAYLFAGQVGMAGAAILASEACLRSGAGKLIIRTPKACLSILQSAIPEAICDPDPNEEVLSTFPSDLTQYQSVGIGPGIGRSPLTKALIWKLLRNGVPNLVLDADALNIISEEGWQSQIPPGAVITPHVREFERLWGISENHFQRLMLARNKAIELKIVIVIKGAHTAIISPDGQVSFNTTGNPGLAKAGTGDVLTGMITGILAQGYQVTEGVKRAIFMHGLAADALTLERDEASILASDIVKYIGISKL